jgi:DNA-binding transcriptional LysR family regulator
MAFNPARFDLVSIRLAVACAQTGSLTAGARETHLALGAASRRIRELEDTAGGPLFERHARGLRPTAAGRVFVRHGLALLQTLEQLGGELTDLRQGVARHIRLCASTAAINQFLPPLLAAYATRQPQVRVELEEQVSAAVVSALREGRADLGVFVEGPDVTGLHTRLFRHDELVLVLPPGHALAAEASPLPFAAALEDDWIGLNNGAAMLHQQQQTALAAGKALRLRMQVRSFDAVCHLVASGLGLSMLPRAAAAPIVRAMGLVTRPLADPWARRRLLLGVGAGVDAGDAAVMALATFLVEPSPTAKAPARKR